MSRYGVLKRGMQQSRIAISRFQSIALELNISRMNLPTQMEKMHARILVHSMVPATWLRPMDAVRRFVCFWMAFGNDFLFVSANLNSYRVYREIGTVYWLWKWIWICADRWKTTGASEWRSAWRTMFEISPQHPNMTSNHKWSHKRCGAEHILILMKCKKDT